MPDASIEVQADAFACLLDELGIKQVGVVGISTGSASALSFVQRHPDRASSLVLWSPRISGVKDSFERQCILEEISRAAATFDLARSISI